VRARPSELENLIWLLEPVALTSRTWWLRPARTGSICLNQRTSF
jgi:hypothetical protein